MGAVDTNVLVRLLVADDKAQLSDVLGLLADADRNGESLFVPVTVILELEWVLRSRYGFQKDEIVLTYIALLEREEFEFQHEAAIEFAIFHSRQSNSDFADCLHVSLAELSDQLPLYTFDRRARRLPGTSSLSD